MSYLVHKEQTGTSPQELRCVKWTLTNLNKHADLNKPEEIDHYISTQHTSNNYKRRQSQVYSKFCEYYKITYEKPYYKKEFKPIKVPTHEKIEMIISNAGNILSKKLQLSLETGMRPTELCNLKVKDIDIQQRIVYPTTIKNGNPRTFKITEALATQLQEHIIRNKLTNEDKLFNGDAIRYAKDYRETRNRLAEKLHDQTIRTIRLYDFRHYYATMLYHKTKDILYVKQQMGHKRIDSTLVYAQLIDTDEDDQYTCKATRDQTEAMQLIETGYEYVTTTPDQIMLYRRRK